MQPGSLVCFLSHFSFIKVELLKRNKLFIIFIHSFIHYCLPVCYLLRIQQYPLNSTSNRRNIRSRRSIRKRRRRRKGEIGNEINIKMDTKRKRDKK